MRIDRNSVLVRFSHGLSHASFTGVQPKCYPYGTPGIPQAHLFNRDTHDQARVSALIVER